MTLADGAQPVGRSEIIDRWRAAVSGAGLVVALPTQRIRAYCGQQPSSTAMA